MDLIVLVLMLLILVVDRAQHEYLTIMYLLLIAIAIILLTREILLSLTRRDLTSNSLVSIVSTLLTLGALDSDVHATGAPHVIAVDKAVRKVPIMFTYLVIIDRLVVSDNAFLFVSVALWTLQVIQIQIGIA